MIQTSKSFFQNKYTIFYANCVAIFLVLVLLVGYLIQINSATQIGLTIQELQTKQEALQETARDLQLDIARHQSISYIQEQAAGLGMIYPSHMSYITTSQPAAAVAKR